jgi:hypothetical protein
VADLKFKVFDGIYQELLDASARGGAEFPHNEKGREAEDDEVDKGWVIPTSDVRIPR